MMLKGDLKTYQRVLEKVLKTATPRNETKHGKVKLNTRGIDAMTMTHHILQFINKMKQKQGQKLNPSMSKAFKPKVAIRILTLRKGNKPMKRKLEKEVKSSYKRNRLKLTLKMY